MDVENKIMELIINGGDARGKALQAINAANSSEFEKAEEFMKECAGLLQKAHNTQTELIQAELNGNEKVTVSLLMVHAQDHLMNAITVKELAEQIITLAKIVYKKN